MKIISFYLPQYHAIPENNEWWCEGFTEWTHMKRAKCLIEGHYQPRVPKDNNYYDLLDTSVMKWQADLAKQFGVYGFCVYHYWFDGKLLLEKPMENFLADKSIDFPFFFCWANDEWTNIWKGESDSIKTLIMNHYNDPNKWEEHFNYLLQFFKDSRYMKEDNKPILTIYNPAKIEYKNLKGMLKLWDELAKKNGFSGMIYTYQSPNSYMTMSKRKRKLFDYGFEYVPPLVAWKKKSKFELIINRYRVILGQIIRSFNKSLLDKKLDKAPKNDQSYIKTIREYDAEWGDVLAFKPESNTIIPGAFTDWDNTPRYQHNGKVLMGASPEKFKEFLKAQIERAKSVYQKDAIMLFAWNEWSEGGYLEPDEKYGTKYLEAIKEALLETNEFPVWDNSSKVFTK